VIATRLEKHSVMRQKDVQLRAGRWPSRVEWFVVVLIFSAISFRFIALPFAALLVAVPSVRLGRCRWLAAIAFLVALASPVDFRMPRLGWLDGNPRSGLRLVHVNGTCQPMRSALRERYGEFLLADWPCLYQPAYVVVWS
jgi:hypothetical protein